MRRSSEDLRRRYDMRAMRGISDADGQGYLYAYVDDDEWKVGLTNNFVRRQEEWNRSCPCPWRTWLLPIRVANRRRAEALAHLLLEMECLDRPRTYCRCFHSATCTTYRPTYAYREVCFLRRLACRLEHNCLSYPFEGRCLVKLSILKLEAVSELLGFVYNIQTKRCVFVSFGANEREESVKQVLNRMDTKILKPLEGPQDDARHVMYTNIPDIIVATRSDLSTSATYRHFDVPTSATSGRSDVPTSGESIGQILKIASGFRHDSL
ncbi:hypothetical protein C8J55DRAFT_492448 [Lentinula edodes]|uniref:Bacteriophage T5 Orf172 DNA-binding domain-containing protein n=1 Tax=Lentinula lateritia TaxID=40482 RepID=A0A9W9DFW5_9AGAR|nr:hypothetical protein C8J55DRAFT_492448 [Lentinula edodes]